MFVGATASRNIAARCCAAVLYCRATGETLDDFLRVADATYSILVPGMDGYGVGKFTSNWELITHCLFSFVFC